MTENNQLVLIAGESSTGKSASLRNLSIKDQTRVMYLNCESNKRLPFPNKFRNFAINNPLQIYEAFDAIAPNGPLSDKVDYVVIDTLTFLMDMYESVYVLKAKDTQKAWGTYQQFFKNLMQQYVSTSTKKIIFTAHTRKDYNESTMAYETAVPVKGALKGTGIEAFFSTVVASKKVPLEELKNYQSHLLNITADDELLGYKHVFQTRPTKQTSGERIRSPMGLFSVEQTYMDNDAELLMNHLTDYYA